MRIMPSLIGTVTHLVLCPTLPEDDDVVIEFERLLPVHFGRTAQDNGCWSFASSLPSWRNRPRKRSALLHLYIQEKETKIGPTPLTLKMARLKYDGEFVKPAELNSGEIEELLALLPPSLCGDMRTLLVTEGKQLEQGIFPFKRQSIHSQASSRMEKYYRACECRVASSVVGSAPSHA